MEILDEDELRDKINDGYNKMCDYNEEGNFEKALEVLFEMWDMIPENKLENEESYSVVTGIIETAIECNNKEIMMQWIDKMDCISDLRNEPGEKEYYRGKVAYAVGDFEKARENLSVAVRAGWRLSEYDQQYIDFLAEKTTKKSANETANETPLYNNHENNNKNDDELDDKIYKKIVRLSDRGDKCADEGDFKKAEKLYLQALEYLPSPKYNWEAATWLYTALGDAAYLQNDYSHAIDYLNEALKCPDGLANPFILLRLGESFYEQQNFEKAKEYLIQSYMCGGTEIFEEEDSKYFELIEKFCT